MVTVIEMNRSMLEDYMDYMFTGNLDSALSASEMARRLGEVSLEEVSLVNFLNTYMKALSGTTGGGGNAGGLVKEGLGKISGKEYTVTQTSVDDIKKYLTEQGFIDDYENQEMIARLERALTKGEKITGADAVYYTHELKEAQLVASGVEQSVAHDMALQYYEVSPYSVYHPDVIRMKPEWWSDGWFKFWNIER